MKILSKNFSEKLSDILDKKKNILIVGHYNPDGDCMGGSLALFHTLTKAGFKVSIAMPSEYPAALAWMPGADAVETNKDKAFEMIDAADIIFYVDFNAPARTEHLARKLSESKAQKIILDHHPNPSEEVYLTFSDTSMSSASEIVYECIKMLGFDAYVDKTIASCIYTGIMTDTLNFSVNSSHKRTFNAVADLLSYGIDKDAIYDKVHNNFSENRLRLVGYLLYEKMKIIPELQFSYMLISQKELNQFNYKAGDNEGIVNMPLSVSDVQVSLIGIETEDYIKISLRSKGDADVNLFSNKYFKGGGHKNAAGGRIYAAFEDAEEIVIQAARAYLK